MKHSVTFFLAFIIITVTAFAQNPFSKLKDIAAKKLPDVNTLVQGKEPVTSSLDDATTEAPELDNFVPVNILPGDQLPRNNDGSFYLFPGVWEFHLKSYCMRAGTYGPSKTSGSGYIYAPLKGPKADIIHSILTNGYKHPEIKQHDIQVLIWAIIARTNLKDMPSDYLLTAAKLLDAKQLLRLNEGLLRKYSQNEMAKLAENLPPAARQIMEAENTMRGMLTDANTKYEDLEKVAVLSGVLPDDGGRKVVKGRWSLTPKGFYIRYNPENYTKMTVQIYVKDGSYISSNYIRLKNNSKAGCAVTPLILPFNRHMQDMFDPPNHPAMPANRNQRLGPSTDKNSNPDDALSRASSVLKAYEEGGTIKGFVSNPLTGLFDYLNPLSPDAMVGHITNFITETGRKISNSLNGDPPNPDYKTYAKAIPFNYKKNYGAELKNTELSQAGADFIDAYLNAYAQMLALAESNDKLGGAKLANDPLWMNLQAQAIMHYKKNLGDALVKACEKWDRYADLLREKPAAELMLHPDNIIAMQKKLSTNGFDTSELAAFKYLRMTDEQVANLKEERLRYNPANYTGNFVDHLNTLMTAWREYARLYTKFPSVTAPWEFE